MNRANFEPCNIQRNEFLLKAVYHFPLKILSFNKKIINHYFFDKNFVRKVQRRN